MSDYFSPTGSELNTGNGENIPKQGEMIGKCNGIRTGHPRLRPYGEWGGMGWFSCLGEAVEEVRSGKIYGPIETIKFMESLR